jgi:hypothetical protein
MIARTPIDPMTGERRTEFTPLCTSSRIWLAAALGDEQACCDLLRLAAARFCSVACGFPVRWRMAMVGKTEAARGRRWDGVAAPWKQFQCADFALLGSCSF